MNVAENSRNVAENIAKYSRNIADLKIVENIPSQQNAFLECNECHKIFKHHSSYYRHQKTRCKLKSEDNTIKELKHEIEMLKLKNNMKDSELERRDNEIEYHKLLTNNAGEIVGKSLSTLTFAMKNFKNAPPIKAIGNDEFKRLVFEDNYGKKIHKNTKISNFDVSTLLNMYYRHNKLMNLFNNIIVKYYKKSEPKDQSIWSSDPSRLTYVISNSTDDRGSTAWMTDKRGVKVNEFVIKPIMEHVDKLMFEHVNDIHTIIKHDNADEINYVEELQTSTEIRQKVRNNITHNKLTKMIIPHFYLNIR
jgi:uncharacterized C2H2 Zn-finger protein